MDKLAAVLLGIGCLVALWLGISAAVGLIFMIVWNAAVVGTFEGAPVLSFLSAWGITFLIGLVGGMFKTTIKTKES